MPAFRFKDRRTEQLSAALEGRVSRNYPPEEYFQPAEYDPSAAELSAYSNYSYWGSTIRTFLRSPVAVFFLAVLVLVLAFTFIEPLLPYAPEANTIYRGDTNLRPSAEYWFGTNSIGQDLWSQIWSGTRTSLFIGFAVACMEAVLGVIMGVLWGYVRKLDFLFTEIYNIFDNVPQTLVVIIISYILRPGVSTMIFAMCLTSWLQTARLVRNQVLIIRDRDYNLASRCLGTPTRRIIVKNLLPYLVSVITMRMALAIPSAIGNEVFVTYIGIGLPLDTPSLGNLIDTGRELMTIPSLRYQLYFPVAVLAVITISFYIIGNAFADAADPKNHV